MPKVPSDLFTLLLEAAGDSINYRGIRYEVWDSPLPEIVVRGDSEAIRFCMKATRISDGEVLVRPQAVQELINTHELNQGQNRKAWMDAMREILEQVAL